MSKNNAHVAHTRTWACTYTVCMHTSMYIHATVEKAELDLANIAAPESLIACFSFPFIS